MAFAAECNMAGAHHLVCRSMGLTESIRESPKATGREKQIRKGFQQGQRLIRISGLQVEEGVGTGSLYNVRSIKYRRLLLPFL